VLKLRFPEWKESSKSRCIKTHKAIDGQKYVKLSTVLLSSSALPTELNVKAASIMSWLQIADSAVTHSTEHDTRKATDTTSREQKSVEDHMTRNGEQLYQYSSILLSALYLFSLALLDCD